jgi:hypothetical protein
MRVVYEPIAKAVTRAIDRADERDQRIDYIELTPREFRELWTSVTVAPYPVNHFYYLGARIVEETR